jgi:hypothetical protein
LVDSLRFWPIHSGFGKIRLAFLPIRITHERMCSHSRVGIQLFNPEFMMTKTKLLFGLAAALALGPLANAGIIYGTGQGLGPNQRDSNWKVLASFPAFTPPSGQTYPYDSYIYGVVPTNWNGTGGFGVNQIGYTNADGTFYWIGPQATADSALPFPNQYGYIIGQSFTATEAGTYDFSFAANGDNLFSFFINGSISNANPMKPTITGGTQIGETSGDFQNIKILTGSAYLNAGTNWAYAVIDEQGFSTGVLVAQSTFTAAAAVPEPGQVAASLLLLGGIGGYVFLKRRKVVKAAVAA